MLGWTQSNPRYTAVPTQLPESWKVPGGCIDVTEGSVRLYSLRLEGCVACPDCPSYGSNCPSCHGGAIKARSATVLLDDVSAR